ncbi:MAG: hypothetical protein HFJ17_00895 [Clostridia bacterium]|nr:hypothetical protein [Clostridia bacterium]
MKEKTMLYASVRQIIFLCTFLVIAGMGIGLLLQYNIQKDSLEEKGNATVIPNQSMYTPEYHKSELVDEVVLNDTRKCFIYEYEEGGEKGVYITDQFYHTIDFAGKTYSSCKKDKIILDDNVYVMYDEKLNAGFKWEFAE